MPRRKKIDVLTSASHDKRSVRSTQKIARELSDSFKPSEIAESLGLSVQKWTSIKKKIESGDVYSPELRDFLTTKSGDLYYKRGKQTQKQINKELKKLDKGIKETAGIAEKKGLITKKQKKEINKNARNPPKGHKDSPVARGRSQEYFWKEEKELKKQIPHARVVKSFPDYSQAVEWWKGISGGSSYFVLSARKNKKTGQILYSVVDIRTNKEREGKKGKLDGVARAREIVLKNIGEK